MGWMGEGSKQIVESNDNLGHFDPDDRRMGYAG